MVADAQGRYYSDFKTNSFTQKKSSSKGDSNMVRQADETSLLSYLGLKGTRNNRVVKDVDLVGDVFRIYYDGLEEEAVAAVIRIKPNMA